MFSLLDLYPISYIIQKGPTVFASTPVFVEMGFKEKSGWYKPTVANVS